MAKMAKFILDKVENIVGKGENAHYEHFLLFPQCFQKPPFFRIIENLDCVVKRYPFPKRQILDSSKLRELADDNFKFDEKCIKFFKWVENTAGKGEIARYEQFLLFPQCLQKAFTGDT